MNWKDQLRTTTFLVTLRYMFLFFVSVSILMILINWAISEYVEERSDVSVHIAAETFSMLYRRIGVDAVEELMTARNQVEDGPAATFYMVATTDYQPVIGNLPRWPELVSMGNGWVEFGLARNGEPILARGRVSRMPDGAWILVAREVSTLGALNAVLDRTFAIVLGITLLLALAGGILMSDNVLKRVNVINTTSRQIMAGDLSQRIPTRTTRDEFDELSLNLNAMLDQIESLMASVRHVSDNVAHDLRTPLTRLRNRLEALREQLGDAEAAEIDACIEDADGLLATFASLLSIARIESGASESQLADVDVDAIARDACDLYQALAEDKNIELSCSAPGSHRVRGDRNLLFQAMTNILDNAIKYSPGGGRIHAQVSADSSGVILTVTDSGPGIPEDHRDQVLQRFYRLDEARSAPGAGLGLSLVKAIAQRHKARLLLEDNRPGLRVRLIFPRATVVEPLHA